MFQCFPPCLEDLDPCLIDRVSNACQLGIVLGSLVPWQAALVGIQILLLLALIGLFEFASPATDPATRERAS